MISESVQQANGTLTHIVDSPYQAGETAIHVHLPDDFERNQDARVLYVLPVEPHDGEVWGNSTAEILKHDLHNRFQLICVKPTFSHPPWYADHPSDPEIQQESHFLNVVVPFIDETYCSTTSAPTRLLLGFSKSGWGACSLLLRHLDMFDRAAAFDAPLAWETPNRYGMSEVFGTQTNMDQYCIIDLMKGLAEELAVGPRFALYGYNDFRGQLQFLHYYMLKLGIPNEFQDGPRREHRWDSGWVPSAVEFLAREETRLT